MINGLLPCHFTSNLFVGIFDGLFSPSYLQHCLWDGLCFLEDVEQRYYQMAKFVSAMLGVALLIVHMVFSATVIRSSLFPPVVKVVFG